MSKCVTAHCVDDLAVLVDEQCPLHIGARRDNGIMNSHSPQNLQGCPAHIDLIASYHQCWRPLDYGRRKSVASKPIGSGEPRYSRSRNQYPHLRYETPETLGLVGSESMMIANSPRGPGAFNLLQARTNGITLVQKPRSSA